MNPQTSSGLFFCLMFGTECHVRPTSLFRVPNELARRDQSNTISDKNRNYKKDALLFSLRHVSYQGIRVKTEAKLKRLRSITLLPDVFLKRIHRATPKEAISTDSDLILRASRLAGHRHNWFLR